MRSLVSIIMAVILIGTSIADGQSLDIYQGCWKSNLPHDGTTSEITFCISGQSVEAAVYYPNRTDPPTTCRSKGRVESTEADSLLIQTRQGACENGRTLAAAHLTCTLLGENELSCLHPNSVQIPLVREDSLEQGGP